MKRLIGFALCALIPLACFSACSEIPESYSVSYAYDGTIYELNVTPDKLYSLETIPKKTGYEFKGLFDARVGGVQFVDENGISVEPFISGKDLILYPQFVPKEYTFDFDYRGGNSEQTTLAVQITYGEELAGFPFDVTMDNKKFAGWFTEPDGQGEQITDDKGVLAGKKTLNETNFSLPDNGRINLFAYFVDASYKVTFSYGDGYSDEVKFVNHGALVAEVMPVKIVAGKYVSNWSTEQDDTEMRHAVTSITADSVLYPCRYGYGIIFDTGDAQPVPALILPECENINLPVPSMDGYTFVKWTKQDGSDFAESVMPAENFTLVAKWKKNPTKITFSENGGTDVADITAEAGTALNLPNTSRNGYDFAGWYREDGSRFTENIVPQNNITLIARWYKRQEIVRTLTSGSKHISSSKTGIIFTIDLSEYLSANDTTDIRLKVSYSLKVVNYTNFLVTPPTWFDFLFFSRNEVNAAYKFGDAVCTWKGEYGSVSNAEISTRLSGNKIYIAADSNTWSPGFEISNFAVNLSFTEHKLS